MEDALVAWATGGRVLALHRFTGRVIRERALAAETLDGIIEDAVPVLEPHLFDGTRCSSVAAKVAGLIDCIDALSGHAASATTTRHPHHPRW
ncbi:hypothetical protein [Nocardia sp. NPDC057227]|uniref:hypothetical protein n=1 Tax=Nocardia sp. NPDC057227 TaxID=3346056 RepID=UPI00363C6733